MKQVVQNPKIIENMTHGGNSSGQISTGNFHSGQNMLMEHKRRLVG